MKVRAIITISAAAVLITACDVDQSPPVYQVEKETVREVAVDPIKEVEEARVKIEVEKQAAIDAARQSDPNLNWVRVGISTGKFSESISTTVHKTYAECLESAWSEANDCVPTSKLPDSYWNAEGASK